MPVPDGRTAVRISQGSASRVGRFSSPVRVERAGFGLFFVRGSGLGGYVNAFDEFATDTARSTSSQPSRIRNEG